MKKLSDVNIKKLFPSHIYRRGVDYYNRNRVHHLTYDSNHHVWTAMVAGTESYLVEINMKEYDQGTVDTHCECPAFQAYQSCKHVAATIIAISKQETKNEYTQSEEETTLPEYDYHMANHFINTLSSVKQQENTLNIIGEKSPLHVEYYCKWSYDKKLLIELKAGDNRCLVVKDVALFLEDVLNGQEHYFTKNFTYLPDQHFVSQADWDIFEMLYHMTRNEEIYQGYTFYPQRKNTNEKRFIVIPALLTKELLEKLVARDFTVESEERTYPKPVIVKEGLPFHFHLLEDEQKNLVLSIDGVSDATYFKLYQLLFSDGVFYFLEKEQLPILEQLDLLGFDEFALPIEEKQADTFLSDVMPSLKTIGEVEVASNVKDKILDAPLRAKLYLEMNDDLILGNVAYHYGEEVIYPFNESAHERDYMIRRDSQKEQQIMALIEHANFHYNGKELYIKVDDDTLYHFIYYIIPMLDKYVELFLTSEIESFIMEQDPITQTNVNVESASNLLDIGFDIQGINDNEINHILNAVIEKKRYYRLQSGALLSLENEAFDSIQQMFTDLDIGKDDIQDGSVKMPVYRSAQIDDLIDTKKQYDPSFKKLLHQLKSPEEQHFELPENLDATLREYQETGYQWFKSLSHYYLGGILADDMGLGKTLQTIAYLLSEPSDKPHLIVVPSSVVYNWKNEFQKFAPDLSVGIMTGPPIERREKMEQSIGKGVWITSYSTLRQDIEYYRGMNFQTMILDEAQYIKNYATKTSQAIRQVQATRRFALSGTPIENSIEELWAIFQVVLPGLMPSQKKFKQLSHEKIASMTKPFILRRLKQDVLKELPDKIESVYVSELTKDQKDLYVGYLRQLQQEANQSIKNSGFNQNRMKILAGLTRLRQLCCHPSLFIENYQGKSGKLEQLMETVQQTLENGGRMLIFSQFTSMHEIIKRKLEDVGIDSFYLHGGTPSEERVEMSERFNNGEKDVFLISLKAGGTGLNLTGADTVILYDLWWNPAVEDQATGRAHRFGQKKVVQVIRLITEGTIEEKIYQLQQKKRELIDQVIQPGETMLSSLSEEDVRELLNI